MKTDNTSHNDHSDNDRKNEWQQHTCGFGRSIPKQMFCFHYTLELKPRKKERMSHYPGGSEALRDNWGSPL